MTTLIAAGSDEGSRHRRAFRASESRLRHVRTVGLSPGVARVLHSGEIPIDAELVRRLVARAMPAYADAPVRRLASSGSTNALFRLGDELLVRLPRQPGGSQTISKEATWLPVLGPLLPVSVPDLVAVFDPDTATTPSAGQWSAGSTVHPPRWSTRTHPWTHDARTWR